ncbi:hypothetical protein SAMN04489727_8519 [Amycolatopsis tolypomycina]|uniref:Yip1 domain-containing protein n=1 Tax=Amycolatopsis tolypomycina TaxID=208445 RepID=A0A1H5BZ19_9PSEU|nr:hypothetical protein [Amycolatopsis tolypomycina]SED59742.1 hypothetical protein SAMN04489727_8519 [Amycolatopsis tolypomycina]
MGQWWDLWMRWWAGEKVDGAQLWGLPMLVWGRIGKGLQFAGGLTVVLDLVGPERLRAFGKRLYVVNWTKKVASPAEGVSVVVAVVTLLAYLAFFALTLAGTVFGWAEHLIRPVKDLVAWAKPVLDSFWFQYPLVLLIFFIALGSALAAKPKSRAEARSVGRLGCLFAPVVLVAAILAGLILLPWAVVIYGICWPLSRGIAFLLDHKKPGWIVYVVAFAFVVIGFHFDMLAS